MNRRRRLLAVLCLALLGSMGAGFPTKAAVPGPTSVTKTETITRTHLVDGTDKTVDRRSVTVGVSTTKNLRDRQTITVSWKGAHPSGGLVTDHNSAQAAQQEFPVMVMQCRGVDSTTVSASKRISPETCWTLTPGERFQYSRSGSNFPPFRMDRYAITADRAAQVKQPAPLPAGCRDVTVPRWVPFVAADGTVYPGGLSGCAGVAPEAAASSDSLQPGNTTYGVADSRGNGSAKFVIQNADTNASLGCSATVTCSLVVIPIMGVSCDAAGTAPAPGGMLPADRPPASSVDPIFQECSQAPHFPPGVFNGGGEDPNHAVTGELWWSASNWRNRVSVPLTFATSASVCDVVNNSATAFLYGAEAMAQATQQWAPSFCLDPKLFTLRHVQTSEPQAKNLLAAGNIQGALQAGPPATRFPRPTVQAPAALTGFAIAYSVDDANGNPYANLKLTPRLLAKLLSESYRSCAGTCLDFTSKKSKDSGFAKLRDNPIDMSRDPEFQALNPRIPATHNLEAAAALAVMSSDSDLMTALSSYLNADPEARSWLDGTPDPWGMVVNPAYKHLTLPVTNWPLLDTHLLNTTTGSNGCLDANPVPYLPLVAAPVSNPATVALNLQFDIANSQLLCKNNGQQNQKLTALGRQQPGSRFLIGLVSLADAARYQLGSAALQTHRSSTGTGTFTSAAGRAFAGPTDAALRSAGALLRPDDALGTWPIPYGRLRTESRGAGAYPGTVLVSADVPTKGLPAADAKRYAQFLRFVAGPGQVPGLANGQLPPGYLPLTSTNGLGALAAYTSKAADAVAAQKGTVPLVSGKVIAARTDIRNQPAAPAPRVAPGGPPSSGGSAPPGPGATRAPASSSKRPPPTAARSAASSPSVPPVAVGKTSSVGSGIFGLALPALLLAALVAAGVSAWTSRVGRR